MEKTINIKFDEKQLDDIVKRVTENIIKEVKKDSITELTYNEPKQKYSLMYLEVNETHSESMKEKIYYGYAHNTLSKDCASQFYLDDKFDIKEVDRLKKQGWKEEVFYK